ncbi:MAG: hypothetical protein AB7O97_14970 [Planctomycetota bacterium]
MKPTSMQTVAWLLGLSVLAVTWGNYQHTAHAAFGDRPALDRREWTIFCSEPWLVQENGVWSVSPAWLATGLAVTVAVVVALAAVERRCRRRAAAS